MKKKNCFVAYLAWLVGLHGFYCDKPILNIVMFGFCFIGALAVSVDGGFTLGVYWIALLVQAFLIPSWVREANQQAQKEYEDMIAQVVKKVRNENA